MYLCTFYFSFSGAFTEACRSKVTNSIDGNGSEFPNYGEYPQEKFFEDTYNGPWPSVLKKSGKPLLSAKFKRKIIFIFFLRIITLKVKCRWRCSQIAFIDRIIVNNCIEILTFFFDGICFLYISYQLLICYLLNCKVLFLCHFENRYFTQLN